MSKNDMIRPKYMKLSIIIPDFIFSHRVDMEEWAEHVEDDGEFLVKNRPLKCWSDQVSTSHFASGVLEYLGQSDDMPFAFCNSDDDWMVVWEEWDDMGYEEMVAEGEIRDCRDEE